MATQIEVLTIEPDSVRLALYYVAAVPIADAADPSRTPAGTRLSLAEQQALKDGTLIEVVRSVSINKLTKAEAAVYIESRWAAFEAEAQVEYQERFQNARFVGMAFDGTTWS